LTAFLQNTELAAHLNKQIGSVASLIRKNTADANKASAAFDKAFRVIFRGLTADERVKKTVALATGAGTPDEQRTFSAHRAELQTFYLLAARNRVLAVERERLVALLKFAQARTDAARAAVVADFDATTTALGAQLGGPTKPPSEAFTANGARVVGGLPDGSGSPMDAKLDAERALLAGEFWARRTVLAQLRRVTAAGDVIVLPIVGDFVRVDRLATEIAELHRIPRKGSQWEWWHYQYFNWEERDPRKLADTFLVEMARELGLRKLLGLLHLSERPGKGLSPAELASPTRMADVNAQYEWWRGLHPNEFQGDVHYTGFTLAELLKLVG
jgi:hypothetical protein